MSRIAWFAAGALAGVYGLLKTRRAARVLSPDGLAARAAAVNAGLRTLTGEVSAAAATRRDELHERLRTAAAPRPMISDGDSQTTGALNPHGDG